MNRILSLILISMLCIMVIVSYNYDTSGLMTDRGKACCSMGSCSSKTDCGMKK